MKINGLPVVDASKKIAITIPPKDVLKPMYLVHKEGATSTKYVFGVPASKCRKG